LTYSEPTIYSPSTH